MRESFNVRMDEYRAIAQERRNRGLPTGKTAAGWIAKRRPIEDDEGEMIERARQTIGETF